MKNTTTMRKMAGICSIILSLFLLISLPLIAFGVLFILAFHDLGSMFGSMYFAFFMLLTLCIGHLLICILSIVFGGVLCATESKGLRSSLIIQGLQLFIFIAYLALSLLVVFLAPSAPSFFPLWFKYNVIMSVIMCFIVGLLVRIKIRESKQSKNL